MASGVTVLLLGDVEARRPSGPISIPGPKLPALLALLALSAPGPVSDGRLIDELWGDEQLSNPTNSLHSQIAILRRAIGRDVVVRTGHGYALAVEPDDVDATRFVRIIERSRDLAREGDHRSAAQGFHTAIELVRGPPLGDLLDYAFGRQAATRLDELLLDAHEGRADAELASGRHADLVVPLTELVRLHPLRERFHAQLITALYRCGRQADALRAFRAARATLVEELGLEPGPELRGLEVAVLSHDPVLAAPLEQPAAPPGSAAVRDTPGAAVTEAPIIGRDAELGWLRSDLSDACAGQGRIAVLVGEPGIGKSRLAEELAADARARGAAVAWGRCYAGRGAPAFWPWTQVMQALIAQFPADVVIAALGRGAADVSQLVPEVHDVLPDLDAPLPLGPELERFRVCDALTRSMLVLAAGRPLVVVLEDVHWADASSLEMLSFVAGAIFEAPILIVATYRDVGARTSDTLIETLGDLARQPVMRRIDLAGLDVDGVGALMAARGVARIDDLVHDVHRRTQGNPFFLVEILRLRSSSGTSHDRGALPAGVRDVIRQRVGLLPESTVETMVAASVLGSDFELSTLAASLELDVTAALQRLEPAFDAGLVTLNPDGPGRYRFSHGLVRDTLYEGLGVAQRAMMHGRAAEALETTHGVGEGPHLFAVAEHWFHAVPVADAARGVEPAVRAARWAQLHVAHAHAEEQLRTALALIETMPEGQRRSGLELEVQYELSMLLVLMTGFTSPALDLTCNRMRALCEVVDDRRAVVAALWRVSIFYFVSGDVELAIETAEHMLGLARHDADPPTRLAGHIALGMLHTHRGNQAVARRHNEAAIALRSHGEDSTDGAVNATAGAWLWLSAAMNLALLDERALAEQAARDAIAVAHAFGRGPNIYAITRATWDAAVAATICGDAELTRERCEHDIAIATDQGYGTTFVPYMQGHLGWAMARGGDVDLGLAQIESSASALRASGTGIWAHVLAALAADACLADHRFADALTHTDQGLEALEPRGDRWYEAELHRLRGNAIAGLGAAESDVVAEFATAIEVAGRQEALALRRRAEASLARFRRAGDD